MTASVVELAGLPSLGRAYLGAAGGAVAGLVRRGGAPWAVLPQVAVAVRGVRAERGQLDAYQRLVGEPVGDVLPAGYIHVLSFPLSTALLSRPESTLPLMGMVHISNRVEYHRPVLAGEAMDFTATVVRPRPHKRGVLVDAVADVHVDGALAWHGVSTYLAKGVRMDGEAQASPPHATPPAYPTSVWHLDADAGRRYARVSGDYNPIHISVPTAKVLGFRRPIIHGMYSAARALAEVGPALRGDAFTWSVEFGAPIYLPAWVNLTITVLPDAATYCAWHGEKVHFTGEVTKVGDA